MGESIEKVSIIVSHPGIPRHVPGTGAGLYGRKACCDLFGIAKGDLIAQVQDIITVGDFYARAAGGQIIYT